MIGGRTEEGEAKRGEHTRRVEPVMEAAEKSWRRAQMGQESRSWTGRKSRTRMGRGSRTQGRRRRRPAARFQVSRRAPLSLSPPFPSLDWRESDGCVFGGRYARAAPSFPRARASVSCAHATLRSFPRARNALRFSRLSCAQSQASRPRARFSSCARARGVRLEQVDARMSWRARCHGSKNARTTRCRLGDALKTMI